MRQADVLYITDMAAKLGISVSAMRARVYRMTELKIKQDLPEPFFFGGKWAWKRETVDKWLAEREAQGVNSRP